MGRVPLDGATYWRLRYLQVESERAMEHAAQVEMRYRAALAAAGVSTDIEYRWSDADTSLHPVSQPQGDTPCAPV